jgi:ribonuclease HI
MVPCKKDTAFFLKKKKSKETSETYYVVHKGFQPGIYKTWAECKKQIDHFQGAVFKKIEDEKEAIAFLREGSGLSSQKEETSCSFSESAAETEKIFVYTDGGCILHKLPHLSKAGYGIYIPHKNIRISKPLLRQKITNNRAELTAILEVFDYLEEEEKKKRVCIYTDSQYCMYLFHGTGERYEKKGYRKEGESVPNADLIRKLLILKRTYTMELLKVRAHTGLRDEHSRGNEIADKLASKGMHQTTYEIDPNMQKMFSSSEEEEVDEVTEKYSERENKAIEEDVNLFSKIAKRERKLTDWYALV